MADIYLFTRTDDPRAADMLADLLREYDSRYGTLFHPEGAVVEMNRYPPETFAPPSGNFLLLLRDGVAIAGGAFMQLDENTVEFKRIWTHGAFRRQGLAGRVLQALETQARRQGYARIYLTTGCRQPEAVGLYLRHGYTALFDADADLEALRTLPFEKPLLPRATSRSDRHKKTDGRPDRPFKRTIHHE